MELQYLVETYGGWIALLLFFLYKQVWPLVATKLIPDRLQKEKDLLEARIKSEQNDKEFYRSLQTRQADAMDKLTVAIQTIVINIAETNANIANILANQSLILHRIDKTHDLVSGGITDMKATIGANRRKNDADSMKVKVQNDLQDK